MRQKNQGGQAIIMVTLALFVLIGMLGLLVDRREDLVGQRTALMNQMRSILLERGIIVQTTTYGADHSVVLDGLAAMGASYRGCANALVFASGVLGATSGLVAIVGSETGSVYFDPLTVREASGSESKWQVAGGFFEVSNNVATVLADIIKHILHRPILLRRDKIWRHQSPNAVFGIAEQ